MKIEDSNMTCGFSFESWKLLRDTLKDVRFDDNIMAVAEGVNQCPSRLASRESLVPKLFVRTFTNVLSDYNKNNRDENAIRNTFEEGNKKIKLLNERYMPNKDYQLGDLAGCVATGTSINEEVVSFGYLASTGVAIFDVRGKLKFRIEENNSIQNNPSKENHPLVLTGEETAMNYVRTGTQELRDGETLIIYTNGLEPIVFSEEFAYLLRKGDVLTMKKLCRKKVRTEGSLVYHCQDKGFGYYRKIEIGTLREEIERNKENILKKV